MQMFTNSKIIYEILYLDIVNNTYKILLKDTIIQSMFRRRRRLIKLLFFIIINLFFVKVKIASFSGCLNSRIVVNQ